MVTASCVGATTRASRQFQLDAELVSGVGSLEKFPLDNTV